jgi:RNA polymerase sigma factor (sigma-70 family)
MDETTDNFDLAHIEPYLRVAEEATDESLVVAICSGDESAFEQLFERHRRRVARITGRFFNRPERVEEIVQEVFTKVYFALDDYSSERGRSFAAWLSRIVINACYDELRRGRRRPESSISDITDDEVTWLNSRVQAESAGGDAESVAVSRCLMAKGSRSPILRSLRAGHLRRSKCGRTERASRFAVCLQIFCRRFISSSPELD